MPAGSCCYPYSAPDLPVFSPYPAVPAYTFLVKHWPLSRIFTPACMPTLTLTVIVGITVFPYFCTFWYILNPFSSTSHCDTITATFHPVQCKGKHFLEDNSALRVPCLTLGHKSYPPVPHPAFPHFPPSLNCTHAHAVTHPNTPSHSCLVFYWSVFSVLFIILHPFLNHIHNHTNTHMHSRTAINSLTRTHIFLRAYTHTYHSEVHRQILKSWPNVIAWFVGGFMITFHEVNSSLLDTLDRLMLHTDMHG